MRTIQTAPTARTMRTMTINLDENVFKYLELRAAIDDLRPAEAVEGMLTEIVLAKLEGRPIIREGRV